MTRLRETVITMASYTRQNLANAMRGLLERDDGLCEQAMADDQPVNQLEKAADKLALEILARFQPLAHDLREVVGIVRIANNLERISDQASSIAKRARKLNSMTEVPETFLIEPVYQHASKMLEDSVDAFIDGDTVLAGALPARDKWLDAAENKYQSIVIDAMKARPASLESCLHLVFVGRYLERVGDHTKNIAEDIIFIESAEDVRFSKDKRLVLQPA